MADTEDIELEMLVESIFQRYGFDFRSYARASLKRRLLRQVKAEGLATISRLQERVLREPACMERVLLALSINVTSMFRDPEFFATLRREVVPLLRTYPDVRIWIAGCSSGEEVYSLAIVLKEEGLYPRTRLYATDMNEVVLEQAKRAVYPLSRMQEFTEDYQRSGGTASFSEYYHASHTHAVLDGRLKDRITFAQHNLATDASFNEFHLILCRNVMIYFDAVLRARAVSLFRESLSMLGFLGLGRQEALRASEHGACFEVFDSTASLYRRVKR